MSCPSYRFTDDEGSEEVHLMLVVDPSLVHVLERVDEAGLGELGKPHVVEKGDIGRLALGDGVPEELVERGPGTVTTLMPTRRRRSLANHPRPWPFRGTTMRISGLIGPPASQCGLTKVRAAG